MHYSTELPLHGGKAPRWLFGRMVRLSSAICTVIIDEFGSDELLSRLCDSNWFQALACAIGYDWHSSGTTTVTIGALKEALNQNGEIFIAGGKGKAGLRTPQDIVKGAEFMSLPGVAEEFSEYSRLAAKIDSALVYDEIGIYQHSFIFTKNKKWGVVQQAIDEKSRKAIRFQWLSDKIGREDMAVEPHSGIASEVRRSSIDLTFNENAWSHSASVEIINDAGSVERVLSYPSRHEIVPGLDFGKRGLAALRAAEDIEPENYRELLLVKGMGRSTLRSLALVSSLIYDKELAQRDPIAYAYNLGGKDGIPFPVDRQTYDSVIREMNEIIENAKLDGNERYKALRRLNAHISI